MIKEEKVIRIAQTPSRGTLRPCKEESKNWYTKENLYIEGDNLAYFNFTQTFLRRILTLCEVYYNEYYFSYMLRK